MTKTANTHSVRVTSLNIAFDCDKAKDAVIQALLEASIGDFFVHTGFVHVLVCDTVEPFEVGLLLHDITERLREISKSR